MGATLDGLGVNMNRYGYLITIAATQLLLGYLVVANIAQQLCSLLLLKTLNYILQNIL